MNKDFDAWIANRPAAVQKVAKQFPPGASFIFGERQWWVVAYRESESGDVMLRLTPINPHVDYDGALAAEPIYVCPEHLTGSPTVPLVLCSPTSRLSEGDFAYAL